MNVKKQLLIFAALTVLLLGAASATDVSDDVTDSATIAEEAVQQTQTATDINNIATQDNEEKDIEMDTNPGNDAITTQNIQKNTNKANTKEAVSVTNWEKLKKTITGATEDTTITLQKNLTNEETITLNKRGITITIDGNGKTINGNQKQVFYIYSRSTLILNNITITNAKSDMNGGAICNYGTLTITGTTLNNNTATNMGGAICNYGTLTITGTTLNNNTANYGGAIGNNRTLNITHTTLNNNTANYGGAIYNNEGTLNITHTTLNNNTATEYGGAIYNYEGTLNITHTTLTNNTAESGGAIYNYGGTLNITHTTLNNNTAESGGAIRNEGTLNITNTTLQNNTATNMGGAIRNEGTLNITNTTLQNNTATNMGGAINNNGTLTITHTTLNNNTAESGGAINNYGGTLNITHTTLQNNTATNHGGAIRNSYGGNVSISYSTLNCNNGLDSGGAIYDWVYSNHDNYIVLFCSNFTENKARQGAVIYNNGNYGIYNITYNRFRNNTADNKETLYLGDKNRERTVEENTYDITDIKLKTINLTITDEQQQFTTEDEIKLKFTLELENKDNYDEDILEKLNKTLYINDKENVSTTSDSHTLSNLKIGTYSLYYTSCNQQSNTVTFEIIRIKEKDVNNYAQLIDAISEAKNIEYTLYTINLHPGNYNATNNIEWGDSATHNIIINGNGITLNGNNTHQFINITNKHNNLTIKNITITNYTSNDVGGAIQNNGTLTITDSTLQNNNATRYGGAIYNNGTLTITDSTLNNNTANIFGGAISNSGTLTITHTTLTNNTAKSVGGAIRNNGTLNITDSTLQDNNASFNGGAIQNNNKEYINVINSNFTRNYANRGGAIYSEGYANLTGNIFTENTAINNETIDLNGNSNGIFKNNQYKSTDIALKAINLSIKDNKESFEYGENIELNLTIEPKNSNYYYNEISEAKIDRTIFINNEQNDTTTNESHTLSNLEPGKYTLYYTSSKQQSNPVTFKVMGNSEITTPNDSYDYYDGIKNNVTLNIKDPSEEKGTADIQVKDNNKYQKLLNYPNVKNGYTISTKTLKEALKNLYNNELGDSYTINVTYSNEYVYPSSTEFTLNIIKQRNSTITYDILNNTQGNIQINITVQDDIYKTPITDATIKITGDIQQETTTGVITDNTLTPGYYTINVQYEENTDYKASTATIDFIVEIDKDKKISELENNITNITNQLDEKEKELEEANKIINALNETNKKLTQQLKEVEDQIKALTNTITDLNKEIQTLNNTVNNLTEELKDANNKINTLNNTNKELTKELEDANKEIETLNNKINNLTEQLKNANDEINSLNNVNDKLTKQLEDANKEIETLNNKINNLTEQLEDANNEINSLNNTNDELTEDLETANNKIQTLNNKINNLTEQLTEAINQMKNLTDKVNNLTNQLKDSDKQINDKNKEIQTLSDTINSLTEQLNNAKEKIENLNKIIDKLINKKPLNTTITINPIKASIGEITTLTANIIAQNGNKVTGGKAVFKVNGITLKDENNNVLYATVTDGTASISYKVQDVWMKNTSTVQAVYSGTEKYAQSRTNASDVLDITTGKATITLEKDTITAKAGQTLTLKVTVFDANSDRINTGKVVFKLNGKTLKDNNGETLYAYVKDGQALLDYTIPDIYSAKTYTLTAVYGGGNYQRAETNGTLNLERKAVNINTDKITTKNNKTNIKATITDETGKLLVTSTKLAIKINQKTILNNVTSTNGKIDVSFTLPLRPGMYELTIISGENGLYKKGTMTTVLKI